MTDQLSSVARAFASIIGIAVLATLALQTTINTEPGTSPVTNFALMLRFFTIWSNFAAGLVMVWIAFGKGVDERVMFALATALTIVALVYHLLLAADHHPVGLDWWTNLNFHTLLPAGFIVWWLVFSDRAITGWRSLPFVMIFPVIYTIFALIYGASTGFYAYFFLDLPTLGWAQLTVNILGLALFFMAMGASLLSLRRAVPQFG